jgi:hypothetical protein
VDRMVVQHQVWDEMNGLDPFKHKITVFCHGEKESAILDDRELRALERGRSELTWHCFRPKLCASSESDSPHS